jgi:integrase
VFETGTGLGLRLQRTGVASYIFQATIPGRSKPWRETLGRRGKITIEDARRAAKARAGEIALGLDPFEERENQRAELAAAEAAKAAAAAKAIEDRFTLRVLLRQWDRDRLSERRRSYALKSVRAVEIAFASFLDTPVSELSPIDKDARAAMRRTIRTTLDRVGETRGPGAASVAGRAVVTMFSWATKRDLIAANPLRDFELPPAPKARDRKLAEAELRRAFKAAASMGYPAGVFICLLILTGCRVDEIRRLQWPEIAADGRTIWLPAERVKTGRVSGGHRVHLSEAARAVLAACPRHQCSWVFTNDGRVPLGGGARLKKRLDAILANDGGEPIAPWRLHDLRRSMVSALSRRKHNPLALDAMIGHKPSGLSDIALIYNVDRWEDEQIGAAEDWGCIVTSPEPEATNITSLNEARAARVRS